MDDKKQEIAGWIETNLCDENGYFRTESYPNSTTIYETEIIGPLLAAIVNGNTRGANFKGRMHTAKHEFDALIRKFCEITRNEQTYWFYYQEPDFAYGVLKLVEKCDYAYAVHRLEYFETDPADQGGPSYLGLLPGNYEYLLLHSYVPWKSFKISVHGEESFVAQFINNLKEETA